MEALKKQVVSEKGDWTVKGFIDIYKRIYTISLDTKVLSKVLEILMFPVLAGFAEANGYEYKLARQQNQYPDLTFIAKDGTKFALDIKSTFRKGDDKKGRRRLSGMTLGTFAGYFRDRTSNSISTYPYNDYAAHYVLGVVYSQVKGISERKIYKVDELAHNTSEEKEAESVVNVENLLDIPSVAKDFEFFIQEKYKIAADTAGSGNTKNIGSTKFLDRMVSGTGVFASLGIQVFDDYWMNYRTKEMARADGLGVQPYKNLVEYRQHIQRGGAILRVPASEIISEELELEEDGEPPETNGIGNGE
ncbi:MAG: type II restriction endonuclease [Acidiferrobacteraceae bacterium]